MTTLRAWEVEDEHGTVRCRGCGVEQPPPPPLTHEIFALGVHTEGCTAWKAEPPVRILCPACGHMGCEHMAEELKQLRAAALEFADWLERPGLDTSTRWALENLLAAAGAPRKPIELRRRKE